jgi:hypothetical protein
LLDAAPARSCRNDSFRTIRNTVKAIANDAHSAYLDTARTTPLLGEHLPDGILIHGFVLYRRSKL